MDDREYELARQVLRLANRIVANRNRHLRELGLTAEQADSLLFFAGQEEATATDLKEYLGVRHQTARGIVRRMADKGLITLAAGGQDARCRHVALTEQGRAAIGTLRRNGRHTGQSLLRGLSPDEQAQFARLIGHALENVQGQG